MGNPTYSGLELVQAEFQETVFPLPAFRADILSGIQPVYSCGLPIHKFVLGVSADLHSLATEDSYGQPKNVALCSENGEYGLRFVEEWFLRDVCALSDEQRQSSSYIVVRMEPYGSDRFLAFVNERSDAIGEIARYGKENPSIKDRFVLLLWPERYVFPGHIEQVA
jgi:hypothetical protein